MTHANKAGLFESFNARNLAQDQVARTFVPPDFFQNLIGPHHTLVVGPRGSGKTTLLKMMQYEALDAWDAPEAVAVRALISYHTVYIATDISLGPSNRVPRREDLQAGDRTLLATASFTTQILRRLVDVMDYLSSLAMRPPCPRRKRQP